MNLENPVRNNRRAKCSQSRWSQCGDTHPTEKWFTQQWKGKVIEQKSLSISDLQIDYLNLESLVRNNEREIFSQSRFSHCGGLHPT